tara:strand:+ start:4037 stop:5512 length:1476 start_codon:yes stop_codon:yes gene_type:complete
VNKMATKHIETIIVGAGLSGICAGYHLQKSGSDSEYIILEARDNIGGTWDLFRYPGIRSDSDMFTLGYPFRPWQKTHGIAEGPEILQYIVDTADTFDITKKISFRHRVMEASWDSQQALWTLTVHANDEQLTYTCQFLLLCTGYYRYEHGYTPKIPGMETFKGLKLHPQHWPQDTETKGKRIVVIGSGATAMTLVPALAQTAEHVTMLQRSPTYVISRPRLDLFANFFGKWLPNKWVYHLTRFKNAALHTLFYQLSKKRPERVKRHIHRQLKTHLGPDFDIEKHFTPAYNPWDQRVCLIPDADLFHAINAGTASVETDHIERVTEDGIQLRSGKHLQADIIVTATGLDLLAFGGMTFTYDEEPIDISQTLSYRGVMLSGVPNLAFVFGYTNASWTLKANMACEYIGRLRSYMKRKQFSTCTPTVQQEDIETQPLLDLKAGYIKRGESKFPSQGSQAPWRMYQNVFLDAFSFKWSDFDDPSLQFESLVVEED